MPTLVTHTAAQFFSHPTWDVVMLLALLAITFFYGITTGKRKIVATIFHTYIAFAIFPALPISAFVRIIGVKDDFLVKIGTFVILFLMLALLMGPRRARSFASAKSWWQIFLLSFLQAGLLLHILLGFLPLPQQKMLAPITKSIFTNSNLHIWWLVIPVIILIVIRRLAAREE